MVELRPLVVVTGTLHVEGGLKRARTNSSGEGRKLKITEELNIGPDRRAGNVVAARYLRKLKELKILHTPFGILIDPKLLDKVKDTISQAVIDSAEFNREHKNCRVANTMVWEHLRGNRLDAVTAWVDRRMREGDTDVTTALGAIIVEQAA